MALGCSIVVCHGCRWLMAAVSGRLLGMVVTGGVGSAWGCDTDAAVCNTDATVREHVLGTVGYISM